MDEIIKVIGILVGTFGAVFAIFKVMHEVLFSKLLKHREDYQFAKNYIQDLYDPNVHTFVLEKGFKALTGDLYSIGEIKKLLSYTEPTKALQLRASCSKIIYFDPSTNLYHWQKRFADESCRIARKRVLVTFYFISSFTVMYPLSLSAFNSPALYELSLVKSLLLASLSIYLLIKYSQLDDALIFMKLSSEQPSD